MIEGGLAKYLPAVGLLIGGLLFGAGYTMHTLLVPHAVMAILLAILWLVLSGGIHFDGLMDTADGIFSHRSPERMLEIMRDSRVGNFGVITGFCVLLTKVAGMLAIGGSLLICAVLLIPAWARWCEAFAIGAFPYAREEGMGKVWHDTMKYPADLAIAAIAPLLMTAGCAINFGLVPAIATTCATIVVGVATAFYLSSIIKGHTGDTYGATVEIAEAGGLLILALFAARLA